MPCWSWHKSPSFSEIFSITAATGGREKTGFFVTFLYLFMVLWWFSSLILSKLLQVENLLRFSLFQSEPPASLVTWGKCKIYREVCTGAGWKNCPSPVTSLIPVALHGLSLPLHFWGEGRGTRAPWTRVQRSVCVHVHMWDAGEDLAEPVCAQPACLLWESD